MRRFWCGSGDSRGRRRSVGRLTVVDAVEGRMRLRMRQFWCGSGDSRGRRRSVGRLIVVDAMEGRMRLRMRRFGVAQATVAVDAEVSAA